MTLALTISDNQDGSGATAAITGSAVGSTNTVYAVNVPQLQLFGLLSFPAPTWTGFGQRTGDGTVNLGVPFVPGYYWGYCTSQFGSGPLTVSQPQYFLASQYSQSVFQTIRLAVQAKIQGLSLPPIPPAKTGIASQFVYLQGVPFGGIRQYPCVIISDEDEQETVESGSTNLTDDIEYPIRVFIADREGVPFDSMMPTYLLWRERIMSAFRSQRLPNVPTVYTCRVQPQLTISAEVAAKYQSVVSGMTLRFIARQTRG